jgi:hypothetical protein
MGLFRSKTPGIKPEKLIARHNTARAPRNVPYLVDNLWEWKRPDICPNRRHSVYASPSIDLAKQLGGSGNGEVYEVELKGKFRIAQTKVEDSKFHPDCVKLPSFVLKQLGQDWVDGSLEEKKVAGQLWIPCLEKNEVDMFFQSPSLSNVMQSIWETITYCDDFSTFADVTSLPQHKGEVFFEPIDGYHLKHIK